MTINGNFYTLSIYLWMHQKQTVGVSIPSNFVQGIYTCHMNEFQNIS